MRRFILNTLALTCLVFAACAEDRSGVADERKTEKKGDAKMPVVVIDTSMGAIKVELDDGRAPITVKNFLTYVDDKFYDKTIFHRVIEDFMIQGGGFEPGLKDAKTPDDIKKVQKKTRTPIKNESPNGLSNTRGTIAMARTQDLDSATAQFYINSVDNSGKLDEPRYCVFGKVIDGMDVVDKIRKVKTQKVILEIQGRRVPAMGDVPAEDVIIKSIRRADKK
jgi:peptidyl-prolyl cis-trans isomerase B (cyclophilin B)